MTEQYRYSSGLGYPCKTTKMENEFSPKKTMIILVIVVGCFAVLWPKVFYPMLIGSADQHIKPSAIDKTTGCCYVLSETDVDTIKIMSELCGNIIRERMGDVPLTGKQIIHICQEEVLNRCGIDISAVLQEQVRLGQSTKQILDEIRSLNGSLCLKYNFGVQPWRLGVPHLISLKNTSDSIRQERSAHVRSEMVHPAFRQRGRAIPETGPPSRAPPRIIEGRPGPIPGMRPTMGGAGRVVQPSKQGTGSMGVIMPIYTIAIVIFFTYTLMKIIFKKHPDTDTIYSTIDQDGRYRKDMIGESSSRGSRENSSCKLVVNAMSALLDEVDQEIEARRQSSEVIMQDDHTTNATLSNGSVRKEEKPSVKIMGMETSESCEGGKKWQSANSSVLPSAPPVVNEHIAPPQEIYLDRTLPAQSQILVSDSATKTEKKSEDDPAVVLAGKMTLSVISLENDDIEIEELQNSDFLGVVEKEIDKPKPILEEEIDKIIEEAIENIENIKTDSVNENFDEKVYTTEIDGGPEISPQLCTEYEVNSETCDMTNDCGNDAEGELCAANTNEITKENKDDIVPESDKSENISNGGITKREHAPLLDLTTTSSSEDSGTTVIDASVEVSETNISGEALGNEHLDQENEDPSREGEESEVEYEEVSEEEIDQGDEDEEEIIDENREQLEEHGANEILNENGNTVLINGADSNNETESDESDEEIEEIIEEYSEEEIEESEGENQNLPSNGKGDSSIC